MSTDSVEWEGQDDEYSAVVGPWILRVSRPTVQYADGVFDSEFVEWALDCRRLDDHATQPVVDNVVPVANGIASTIERAKNAAVAMLHTLGVGFVEEKSVSTHYTLDPSSRRDEAMSDACGALAEAFRMIWQMSAAVHLRAGSSTHVRGGSQMRIEHMGDGRYVVRSYWPETGRVEHGPETDQSEAVAAVLAMLEQELLAR